MTALPWFPLDVPAYTSDTRHFTLAQHGAYLLILMAMWTNDGHLPNDEKSLARVCGITVARWRSIAFPIMEKLTIEGDMITQKRAKKEYERAMGIGSKKSEAGSLGAIAKRLKRLDAAKANGRSEERRV